MTKEEIIAQLPYGNDFLFVDTLEEVSETGVSGSYTFRVNEVFYNSHFKDFAITPGVILIECMAQIGLVCLGIYLQREHLPKDKLTSGLQMLLTESEVEFLKPVFPKETVTVASELIYFRFQKLKCKVKMTNSKGEVVCKGVLSGMLG
ncbi:MAG: hydroxymyristoyl-ACP dehydratase [Flavobacteriaceae bacterium]|nr:hydroxymyristoyl-ACP dehydratase [Flavobacteriaceae bacterium]